MDNQHNKITGYRDLTQAEIDLLNEIKAKGAELDKLINRLEAKHGAEEADVEKRACSADTYMAAVEESYPLIEAKRWTGIGKDKIQLGIMALVRAVARPTS